MAATMQARSLMAQRPLNARLAQKVFAPVAPPRSRTRTVTSALFGFGQKKEASTAAATQYYLCIDCGYIYDGRDEFKKVPSSYKCPACGSPKSRFKVYKGDVRGRPNNSGASMKKRMQERQW